MQNHKRKLQDQQEPFSVLEIRNQKGPPPSPHPTPRIWLITRPSLNTVGGQISFMLYAMELGSKPEMPASGRLCRGAGEAQL